MKLEKEFYRLPLAFDVERLKYEISAFGEPDWIAHPSAYKGNSAIPLISVNGQINDDFLGQMQATQHLERCPYIKQVIDSFNSVFSRSRLMRLAGGCEVPEHSDINYHWYTRVRIHIPIITTPDVIFYCGDKSAHMAPGEAWIFDSWKMHRVVNANRATRIHLVIDTCGSADFWNMVEASEPYTASENNARMVGFDANARVNIRTEKYNVQVVMLPGEVDALALDLIDDLRKARSGDIAEAESFTHDVHQFRHEWRSLWSSHGPSRSGWPQYQALIDDTLTRVSAYSTICLENGTSPAQVLNARILQSTLNPEAASTDAPQKTHHPLPAQTQKTGRNAPCPCGSGKKYKACHGKTAR